MCVYQLRTGIEIDVIFHTSLINLVMIETMPEVALA